MAEEPVVIPEKIYFKIGEVCELVGVQAHVLRYWETEFGTLSPQKNKSGQRSYRRRDVEIALRIKQLLYNEMFTIAGARKKLQADQRDGTKTKAALTPPPPMAYSLRGAPMLFDAGFKTDFETSSVAVDERVGAEPAPVDTNGQSDALKIVAVHLLELREMLRSSRIS